MLKLPGILWLDYACSPELQCPWLLNKPIKSIWQMVRQSVKGPRFLCIICGHAGTSILLASLDDVLDAVAYTAICHFRMEALDHCTMIVPIIARSHQRQST